MNLKSRPTLNALTVAALGAVVGMTLAGGVAAQPEPAPGPSQKVREQNLDVNGLIRVHEQGTANVNVTNPITIDNFPSSISVNNFPATQNVHVTGGSLSVLGAASLANYKFTLAPNHTSGLVVFDFFINASTLHIIGDGDLLVRFHSHLTGAELLEVTNEDDQFAKGWFQTFTQPVPIGGFDAKCSPDSSDNCHVSVRVLGLPFSFSSQ